jgi:hypothetical protein
MRWILCLLATCAAAHAADAAHPTVVELFQSQGCSSCPPANANVLSIASRPDILALSWQVTYWDYLGWTDSFGDRAFTARQWEYARALGNSEVYTPQVVVNGRVDIVGDRREELLRTVARADRGDGGPAISFLDAGRVRIGAGKGPGDVLLVRFDPRVIEVPVARGENAGRTLPHRNVVRETARLGAWLGPETVFAVPPPAHPGLSEAILVQSGPGGRILAAARN